MLWIWKIIGPIIAIRYLKISLLYIRSIEMQNSLRLYRFQRVIVILTETERHVILRIHGSRLLKRASRCTFLHCFRDVEPLRTKLASSALRFSSLQTLSPRKGTKLTKMRKKNVYIHIRKRK